MRKKVITYNQKLGKLSLTDFKKFFKEFAPKSETRTAEQVHKSLQ